MASSKQTVSVFIRGQEFRVRTDGDEDSLQRVAGYLDETMSAIEARTGTVDSLDVALLTGLNLARELVEIRGESGGAVRGPGVDEDRLQSLIELAEGALATPESA